MMVPARKSHSIESTLLAVRLKERIARCGPISVEAFMAACLADKDAGYYPSRQPIGAEGDFITAPEVSQVFGELLGLWAVAVWQSMGRPRRVTVAELGPGRGTLMADALRAWRKVTDFQKSVEIVLVETSPVLRDVQQVALTGAEVEISWCDRLEAVPEGPLIVIANEFVDALPVRQFVWRQGAWRERCVSIGQHGGFAFCDGKGPLKAAGLDAVKWPDMPEGAILEIRPAADAIVAALGLRARSAPLGCLIVDYGHEETGLGDTLQAVSRHAFVDPLQAPGGVDLTAHVDFAALKDAARARGLNVYGPKPQGAFLLALGLETRRNRLCENASDEQRKEIIAGTNRLVDASAMGLLFKALAVTSQGLAPPPGFEDSGEPARTPSWLPTRN